LGDVHDINKMFHLSWLFQQQQHKLHVVKYRNIDKCPQNELFGHLDFRKKKLCVQQRLCTFSVQI
jgi:hypothetical protein